MTAAKITTAAKIVSTACKVVSNAATFTQAAIGGVNNAKAIVKNMINGKLFSEDTAKNLVSFGINAFTAATSGKNLLSSSKELKKVVGDSVGSKWSKKAKKEPLLECNLQFFAEKSDGESCTNTNDSQLYLKRALKNQGLDVTPNRLKETWIEGDYKYTVRIHEGNTKYTDTSSIYRVSRQSTILDANGQGTGIEYLGTDGNWYHQSVLTEFFKGGTLNPDFNENAARITHIAINGGN